MALHCHKAEEALDKPTPFSLASSARVTRDISRYAHDPDT